ncbi:MAG: SPFH domain-containing protein [Treponema sp.]|nr:SPFH domain-containing protein [Treponema sp.]
MRAVFVYAEVHLAQVFEAGQYPLAVNNMPVKVHLQSVTA